MVLGSSPLIANINMIYDNHWMLTWSLILEPVRLIEVHIS